MPTYKDVMLGMKKAMADASPWFQVEWPNSTPESYTFPYVEFSFSFLNPTDETLDSSDEHINGIVAIDVVVEKDTSVEVLAEVVDFIRDTFPRGRRIHYGVLPTTILITESPSPKRPVENGVYSKTPIIVNYRTE